ncbi:acyltransferase [Sulfitobacter sp. S190]|uniref:acyltransferase family protein n=1 Tax=Sulfitobacter sp. S190 TaxID=2867022 RepID=UPI0021A43EBA|nr:acyltransferase [Sulfitobacter sp. S190]UWR22985.1 acyltransferase [Sulfitobacter sp. S190]
MSENGPQRVHAIDSAKGIGIVLVVFGHAWRGAATSGLLPDTPLYHAVDRAIYAFHMPLFFFLSGLLFLDAVQSRAFTQVVRSRVVRLLWPMALWSWLFFGLRHLAGNAVNSPVSLDEFPLIPLPPYEHLWFLWSLFGLQVLGLLIFWMHPRLREPPVYRTVATVLALVIAALIPVLIVPSVVWGPMVQHAPYFLAGIGAGAFVEWRPTGRVALLAAFLFGLTLLLMLGTHVPVLVSLLLVVLAGIALRGLDAGEDAPGPMMAVLRQLGRASMVIYLSHTIFSAAVRIAALGVGLDHAAFVLASTTVAGLAVPFALHLLVRRHAFGRLLGV